MFSKARESGVNEFGREKVWQDGLVRIEELQANLARKDRRIRDRGSGILKSTVNRL